MKKENKLFETIYDFITDQVIDGNHIHYKNLTEVCQGGPMIGNLYINEKRISLNRYGEPLLYDDGFIYVPIFGQSKFILSKIRISDFETTRIGSLQGIICLKKIDGNKIYFQNSIYDDSLKKYDLSTFKISNENDTPMSFQTELNLNGHIFRFEDIETRRNGTKKASLQIDGKYILDHRFGSPFLYNDSQILIPVFTKGFFRSGFKLAFIDLDTLDLSIKGEKEDMISLISFENCNKVIYYPDSEKKIKMGITLR